MIDRLVESGIRPYLVFDGAPLPMKQGRARSDDRATARARSIALLKDGKDQEARSALAKCVGATPWMARKLIEVLRQRDLPFVVAPFEADAQLAFLVASGCCAVRARLPSRDLRVPGPPRLTMCTPIHPLAAGGDHRGFGSAGVRLRAHPLQAGPRERNGEPRRLE